MYFHCTRVCLLLYCPFYGILCLSEEKAKKNDNKGNQILKSQIPDSDPKYFFPNFGNSFHDESKNKGTIRSRNFY